MDELVESAKVDKRLLWPLGRAERLARRGRLPHYILPDGSIRFRWSEIEAMLQQHPIDRPEVGETSDLCESILRKDYTAVRRHLATLREAGFDLRLGSDLESEVAE